MDQIAYCDTYVGSQLKEESLLDVLRRKNIDPEGVYVTCNGKLVPKTYIIRDEQIYHIVPRVLGGKGGFGSMLRSIGAQIEKTTNREACRDLSGRRMRDVNNEQQLRDWVAQKAQRERERERKRKERAEKRRQALTEQRHNFDDPDYHSQRMKVLNQLEDALQQGLLNSSSNGSTSSTSSSTTSTKEYASTSSTAATASAACGSAADAEGRKRKAEGDNDERYTKKACEWLGIDMDNLSDLDSNSDSSDTSDKSDSEEGETVSRTPIIEAHTTQDDEKGTEVIKMESDSSSSASNENNSKCGSLFESEDDSMTHKSTDNVKTPNAKEPTTCEKKNEASTKQGLLATLKQLPPSSEGEKETSVQNEETPIDLDTMCSVADLEAQGLNHLKITLMSMGLKCGGTLQQRAERLWAVKGKSKEEIDPSFFAKPMKKKKK